MNEEQKALVDALVPDREFQEYVKLATRKWRGEKRRQEYEDWCEKKQAKRELRLELEAMLRQVTSRKPISRQVWPTLRAKVMERDHFRCRRCGANGDEARLVVDHIRPLASGGVTAIHNLQTLCEDCNAGKGDREPQCSRLGGGDHLMR